MTSDNDLQEVSLVTKPWFTKRIVWIVLGALVLLAVFGYVLFHVMHRTDSKSAAYKKALTASDVAFSGGDYDTAINNLQSVVTDAKSKQEKVDLYSKLAAAAGSAGQLQKAVDYMNKKHALAPDTASADAEELAGYYERLGNKAKAIELYKQAITYVKSQPNSNTSRNDVESLQAYVTNLEAQ